MSFTAAPERVCLSGLLFDMDGTLVDSTAAVVQHWHAVAGEIGADPAEILATSHGRRSIDVLRLLCPEKATWEYTRRMEGQLPARFGASAAAAIAGARELVGALAAARWAIVTSGTQPLVDGWLAALGLARPPVVVTAESVDAGKPDPAGYLLARQKLGLSHDTAGGDAANGGGPEAERAVDGPAAAAAAVLVLEDSPAGIRAGKAAGCRVLAVVTTHALEQVVAAGPDWVVRDLRSVRVVECTEGAVTVDIVDALVDEDPSESRGRL